MIIKICNDCNLKDICKYRGEVEAAMERLADQFISSKDQTLRNYPHVVATFSCDFVLNKDSFSSSNESFENTVKCHLKDFPKT